MGLIASYVCRALFLDKPRVHLYSRESWACKPHKVVERFQRLWAWFPAHIWHLLFLLLLLSLPPLPFLQVLFFCYFNYNHSPCLKNLWFFIRIDKQLQHRNTTALGRLCANPLKVENRTHLTLPGWVIQAAQRETPGCRGHPCPIPHHCPFQVIHFKLLCKTSSLVKGHTTRRRERRKQW